MNRVRPLTTLTGIVATGGDCIRSQGSLSPIIDQITVYGIGAPAKQPSYDTNPRGVGSLAIPCSLHSRYILNNHAVTRKTTVPGREKRGWHQQDRNRQFSDNRQPRRLRGCVRDFPSWFAWQPPAVTHSSRAFEPIRNHLRIGPCWHHSHRTRYQVLTTSHRIGTWASSRCHSQRCWVTWGFVRCR